MLLYSQSDESSREIDKPKEKEEKTMFKKAIDKIEWKGIVIFSSTVFFIFAIYFIGLSNKKEVPSSNESLTKGIKEGDQLSLNWPVYKLSGEKITLSEEFNGDVLFLNFWATWCGPCVKEMPSIQSLYNQFAGRVAFACISRENSEVLQSFMKKNNYTIPIYRVKGPPPAEWRIRAIPVTFIISRQGIISSKHEGMRDWADKDVVTLLENLIGEGT